MNEDRIKCPYCSEQILKDAKKCRFCGEWFVEKNKTSSDSELTISKPLEEPLNIQAEPEEEEPVKEPEKEFVKSPVERYVSVPYYQRPRFGWLRFILVIIYIGIIIAYVIYEKNAHKVLSSGQSLEKLKEFSEAREKYEEVISEYKYSYAVIEARKNLRQVEEQLGNDFSVDTVYWLPFVVWPVCSVLLFLVFITRILRPGMAFLAFLLLLLGIFGTFFQLVWYGFVSFEPMAGMIEEFIAEPTAIFVASYILLAVTGMMTLTATRKFPFGHHIIAARKMRYE